MFICFVCNTSFQAADVLMAHIKLFHSNTLLSNNLRCAQPSCFRKFSRLHSLKRHLVSHNSSFIPTKHLRLENIDNISQNEEVIQLNNSECTVQVTNKQHFLNFTQSDFITSVTNNALAFLSKLYSIDSISRHHVQLILENQIEMQCNGSYLDILESKVLDIIQNPDQQDKAFQEVRQMFHTLKNMYSGLETEHLRFKKFTECGAYIKPEAFIVGHSLGSRHSYGSVLMEPTDLYGQFIPIRSVLCAFLELPGVLNKILSYMNKLERSDGSIIENLIQAKLWKDKIKPRFPGKLLLPIACYYDEFEPGDTCSPHNGVNKIGGLYYFIPCLPPEDRAALENIFTAQIVYAQDKYFGNDELFRRTLHELQYLETEGITVIADGKKTQVYFALAVFLGDNEGVHNVLGFTSSFNANYCCRRCKIHKTTSYTQTKTDSSLLRNRQNYNTDIARNDLSSTGIKFYCIWNDLLGFHCTENIAYDIMHDLDEGSWNYDMCLLIQKLIELKRFTIDELNNRIQGFDYGYCEASNKPGILEVKNLKKKSLPFTAAETLCFVRHFGLMIADYITVQDKQLWRFYEVIVEIVNILLSPTIKYGDKILLGNLITEHHSLYLKLFPNETLKPKHHNMLHYPECCEEIGPLLFVSCWRFEAKHRPSIWYAAANCCYKNLPETLAQKAQLKFCHRLLSQKGLEPKITVPTGTVIRTNTTESFKNYIHLLPNKFVDEMYVLKWANVLGTHYKLGMILLTGFSEEYPIFDQIKFILFETDTRIVSFILKNFETLSFSSLYQAYEVTSSEEWIFIEQKALHSHLPTHVRTGPNGCSYITFRHKL